MFEGLRVLHVGGIIVVIEWAEKQIEADYKKCGFKIERIDPSDYLNQKQVSIEIQSGELVNIYIIRRR